MPEFYMIFARKMPEFHIIIGRKNIFPNIKGGGTFPPLPLSPMPTALNTAYAEFMVGAADWRRLYSPSTFSTVN